MYNRGPQHGMLQTIEWNIVSSVYDDVMQANVDFSSIVCALKRDARRTEACMTSIVLYLQTWDLGTESSGERMT